jgi:hypothetical protein
MIVFEKGVTEFRFFSASIQTAFKTCNSRPVVLRIFFCVNEPVYEFLDKVFVISINSICF